MRINPLIIATAVTALSLLASTASATASGVSDGLQAHQAQPTADGQASEHYGLFENIRSTFSRQALTPQNDNVAKPNLFDTLPLEKAIKQVKGNGKRRIAVFSDPNCSYCKFLEAELATIDNLTVYTFIFPFLSEKSKEQTSDILCAKNPGSAWNGWMLDGKSSAKNPQCMPKAQELLDIGRRVGITGTPVMIFGNGKRVNGFIRADAIEKTFN